MRAFGLDELVELESAAFVCIQNRPVSVASKVENTGQTEYTNEQKKEKRLSRFRNICCNVAQPHIFLGAISNDHFIIFRTT